MRLDVYYIDCDFSDCCPHFYCGKLKYISASVSYGLPQVFLVYLGIEMIQPGKSFLKFDCWSNKAFKKYEDVIQIMMSLFFMPIKLGSIMRRTLLFESHFHISWTPCLINSQTLKMISLVESFLCPNKQGTPEEGHRIQRPKHISTYHNKDEDNRLKNHNQNKRWSIDMIIKCLGTELKATFLSNGEVVGIMIRWR